jgi:putative inorganic carbon (hco3(-)) transporter
LERVGEAFAAAPAAAPRRIWRPPWYAWALLGVALLAAVHYRFPERLEGPWLLIAPLLAAAAVLVLRRLWELPPAWLMCGAIALTIFSNGWSQIGLGGLPLNRLALIVVLLQFLLRAPGIAATPRLRVRGVHLLMGVTVLYALASAAAAGSLGSQEGVLPLIDVLGLVPFLAFLLAPAIFAGERERNLLLATLVGLGLYLGVTAIFESVGPHALVFPPYIARIDAATPGVLQVGGPFQSPVAEGFAAFACAVASVIALGRWRVPWQRCLAVLSCVTCVFACFATLERGVWLAAVLAAVVTAASTRAGRRWLVPAALACAVGIGVVLALSSSLSQHTSERAEYQQSIWDRQNQTSAGLRMVEARPLLGFGWDRYRPESEGYFRQPSGYPMVGHTQGVTIGLPPHVLPLHDTYLAYAVELGLVGLLLWLASLAAAIAASLFATGPPALRAWKLGLLAIATFFAVVSFFDPHEQPFPVTLLLLWAGVAYGLPRPVRRRPRAAAPRTLVPDPRPRPALA